MDRSDNIGIYRDRQWWKIVIFRRRMTLKRYVNDKTRAFMEDQFADCLNFEQLADLYADFQCVVRELMLDKIKALTEDN